MDLIGHKQNYKFQVIFVFLCSKIRKKHRTFWYVGHTPLKKNQSPERMRSDFLYTKLEVQESIAETCGDSSK